LVKAASKVRLKKRRKKKKERTVAQRISGEEPGVRSSPETCEMEKGTRNNTNETNSAQEKKKRGKGGKKSRMAGVKIVAAKKGRSRGHRPNKEHSSHGGKLRSKGN